MRKQRGERFVVVFGKIIGKVVCQMEGVGGGVVECVREMHTHRDRERQKETQKQRENGTGKTREKKAGGEILVRLW